MRVVVALSGGKASAWVASWAFRNYPKEQVVLYFNDTKWEHPDLYRFLDDLSEHFGHVITYDSDGRSPEQLFYDEHALANNRMPFCSRILKAERLQKFYQNGDLLLFGIGISEKHRAHRLVGVYQTLAVKTGKWPRLEFPLIKENVSAEDVSAWLKSTGIKEPLLYRKGFTHNNCNGGCVRAGKAHWAHLYREMPEVFRERERVEREFREKTGKDVHFLKDETLEQFRKLLEERIELPFLDEDDDVSECIGICMSMA